MINILMLEDLKLPSCRFYSQRVSLNSNDSCSSVTGKLQTNFKLKLYASLPNYEVLLDYVDLGQGDAQEQ